MSHSISEEVYNTINNGKKGILKYYKMVLLVRK